MSGGNENRKQNPAGADHKKATGSPATNEEIPVTVIPDVVPAGAEQPPTTDVTPVRKVNREMGWALEKIAWQLVEAIPSKIEGAPLNQLSSVFGHVLKAIRMIRAEPTDERSQMNLPLLNDEQLNKLDQAFAEVFEDRTGCDLSETERVDPTIPANLADELEPPVPAPSHDGPIG